MPRKTVLLLVAGATVAVGLAGCVGNESEAVAPPRADGGNAIQHVGGSRVKEYRTLGELAKDSTVVARVKATEQQSVVVLQGIEFTITTVTVLDNYVGAKSNGSLKVRQLGGPKTDGSGEVPPILAAGKIYVLFLDIFRNPEPTDEYVVTGSAGIFGEDSEGRLQRLDPMSVNLPTNFDAALVKYAVQ